MPADSTTYITGDLLGTDTVVAYQASTSFTDNNLTQGVRYYYYVFAANSSCTGGPLYLTTFPSINNIILGKSLSVTAIFQQYYFYPETGVMNQAEDVDNDGNTFNKWSDFIVDTITVLIRSTTPPYYPIEARYTGINVNIDGTISPIILISNHWNLCPWGEITGYHYIVIKHKNSIETWSDSVNFSGSQTTYNFYTHTPQMEFTGNMTNAYYDTYNGGLVSTSNNFIYSGDVCDGYSNVGVQDGYITLDDMFVVYDANLYVLAGYNLLDVNGDGYITLDDMFLVYYNSLVVAQIINPIILHDEQQPTQPTYLTLTPNYSTVAGSFTAGANVDHYLIVRSTSSILSTLPVNGTTYAKDSLLGGGKVVAYQAGTTFTDSNLAMGTQYYYYIFSARTLPCSIEYLTVDPLTGYVTINCAAPTTQPTNLILTNNGNSISGSFTASASADHYLIVRSTSDTLTATPVSGTTYTAGDTLGGGTIIAYQTATTFTDNTVIFGTQYYYYVFAANCENYPQYLTANIIYCKTNTDIYIQGSLYSLFDDPSSCIYSENNYCTLLKVCLNQPFYLKPITPPSWYIHNLKYAMIIHDGTGNLVTPIIPTINYYPLNDLLPHQYIIGNPFPSGIYYVDLFFWNSIETPSPSNIVLTNRIKIIVLDIPNSSAILNISSSPHCVGDNVQLTHVNTSNDIWVFNWDGLNYNTNYINSYPWYSTDCPCPGTYNITVTATNSCGTSTSYSTLTVSTEPEIEAKQFCANSPTYFDGKTCLDGNTTLLTHCSYLWNFGDGTTPSTQKNTIHTYNSPGLYHVTFSVRYHNPDINCDYTETVSKDITIYLPEKPIITGNNNNCDLETSYSVTNYISNYSSYTFYWNPITPSGISLTPSSSPPNAPYQLDVTWIANAISSDNLSPGIISVKVTDEYGCSNISSFEVYNCCVKGSETNLHNTIYTPSDIPTSGPIAINGDVTFTFETGNNIIDLSGRHLSMGQNAKIIVNSNTNLIINESVLKQGCNFMWDGIYVNDITAEVDVKNGSTISDAINGLVSINSGIIKLYIETPLLSTNNVKMLNNLYNVKIIDDPSSQYQGSITNTIFDNDNNNHLLQYLPCIGYKTLVGVYCKNVHNITIGDESLSEDINTYDQMRFGIYAQSSNINVYNNKFTDIVNGGNTIPFPTYNVFGLPFTRPPTYPEGAVYAFHNQSSAKTLTVGGENLRQNNFGNCKTAVFSYNYNNTIINNDIVDCFNGISLVDIQSGKSLLKNYTTNINNNQIASSDASVVIQGKGISVRNTHKAHFGYNCQIKNNQITDMRFGISLIDLNATTINFSTVNNNFITYYLSSYDAPVTSEQRGISASGCDGIDISYNHINRQFPIFDPNGDYNNIMGIYIEVTTGANVFQNYMTNMGNGIYTKGIITNTYFNCNTFNHNFYGFRFGANSQLSPQGQAGGYNPYNQWLYDTPISPSHFRMYDDGLAVDLHYYYDPLGSIYDPNLAINSYAHIYTHLNPNGVSKCTENNGGQSGTDPIDNQSKREHALGKIVRGEIQYSFLEEQYRKTDNEYAYKILRNDSTIINMGGSDDNDYQQFYANGVNSDMEKVLKVRKELEEQNPEAAKLKLMQVADDTTINTNRKIVDNIYINTWGSGIFEFTQGQYDTLYAIACLEAYAGGDAVFTARVMLNIDTANVILEYAKAPKHNPQIAKAENVKVYPNPAHKQFTVEFSDVTNDNAVIELYGSMGNLIFTDNIQKDTYIKNIEVSSLNSGLYFYRISINDNIISSGKLTILNK